MILRFITLNMQATKFLFRKCCDVPNVKNCPNPSVHVFCRSFSTTENFGKVTFDELRKVMNNNNALVVDVREPNELTEYGALPNSVNIPLGDVEGALKHLSDEQFLVKYGRQKPSDRTLLVFSCMRGNRSHKAQVLAQSLGFTNVKNYNGGWVEWVEQTKTN